jgi:IS605 OrfB family transposase
MPNFSKSKTKEAKHIYVTAQVLVSKKNNVGKINKLHSISTRVGKLKHYLWDKYGSIMGWNLDVIDLEKQIRNSDEMELIQMITGGISGKYLTRNTYACLKDIVMYQEACKVKLIKAIYSKHKDKQTRKELCDLITRGSILEILQNRWLNTQLRKVFFRGRTWKQNQFVLSKEQYNLEIDDKGKQWLAISTLEKHKRIKLLLKGDCQIEGELRVINLNNNWYIQYPKLKEVANNPDRKEECGVDRGYTEVFATSDKAMLGNGLGKLISARQDKLDSKTKKRNKLFGLKKKYLLQGKAKKVNNILRHNLGRIKLNSESVKSQNKIKNVITKACQDLCKEYKSIVYEDLTTQIKSKKPFRKSTKNKLAHWTKGQVIRWLAHTARLRGSELYPINCAYTSQTNCFNQTLLGVRSGDWFYSEEGVVQADHSAAQNILQRKYDKEITLYTPFKKVKEILLNRTAEYLEQCGKDCTKTLETYKGEIISRYNLKVNQ